jgi:regulator of sirC expression with transglutaminase-like and TPR domain
MNPGRLPAPRGPDHETSPSSTAEARDRLKPKTDPERDRTEQGIGAKPPSASHPAVERAALLDPLADGARRRQLRAQRKARCETLASLLADDSRPVLDGVRRQFEQAGAVALPSLRRAARNPDPHVRARARAILLELDKSRVMRRLVRYVSCADIDLERALFLLGRYQTPRLDPRPYQRALDAMATEVMRRASRRRNELHRAQVLIEYLGVELGYGGSLAEFHHPDNIHLHRVIERRAGVPLALSAVYLLVARRAGLRAAILPLPGHVMLRLYGAERSLIIDPYHKGRVRSELDCRKYLDQHGMVFQPAWLRDAEDPPMFKRQLLNLLRSSQVRGLNREARELNQVVRVLEARLKTGNRR